MPKRIFFEKCKQTLRFLLAVLLCAITAVCTLAFSLIKLSKTDGEREFFVGSASSQGLRRTELEFFELGKVTGESVYFQIDGEMLPHVLATDVAKKYRAEIVRVEYACGVYSFYAYSPLWVNGVCIDGRFVNLHIAIDLSRQCCTVGTPIIFGGY